MKNNLILLGLCVLALFSLFFKFNLDTKNKKAPKLVDISNEPSVSVVTDYSETIAIGNDDYFEIYLNQKPSKDVERKGTLRVVNRQTKEEFQINSEASYSDTISIKTTFDKKYIFIISSLAHLSDVRLISVEKKEFVFTSICTTDAKQLHIWKDYLLYSDCAVDSSRPQNSIEAPNIVAKSLITKKEQILFKSDALKEYGIETVDQEKDMLWVDEYYVSAVLDWGTQSRIQQKNITFNLNTL